MNYANLLSSKCHESNLMQGNAANSVIVYAQQMYCIILHPVMSNFYTVNRAGTLEMLLYYYDPIYVSI